jgi:hypothetical protein
MNKQPVLLIIPIYSFHKQFKIILPDCGEWEDGFHTATGKGTYRDSYCHRKGDLSGFILPQERGLIGIHTSTGKGTYRVSYCHKKGDLPDFILPQERELIGFHAATGKGTYRVWMDTKQRQGLKHGYVVGEQGEN